MIGSPPATDDYLMISALQHFLFCPRQAALIHLEQQWMENPLTVEGQHVHHAWAPWKPLAWTPLSGFSTWTGPEDPRWRSI